jgi:hypothetical protein
MQAATSPARKKAATAALEDRNALPRSTSAGISALPLFVALGAVSSCCSASISSLLRVFVAAQRRPVQRRLPVVVLAVNQIRFLAGALHLFHVSIQPQAISFRHAF